MNTYENFWRRAFEFYAATSWLLFAFIVFVLGKFFENDLRLISLLSLPFLLFATIRFYQGAQNWIFKLKLTTSKPIDVTPEQIIQKHKSTNYKKVWLGYGFQWEQRHAQRTRDIVSKNEDQISPPSFLKKFGQRFGLLLPDEFVEGRPYIHAVGKTEEDIFVDLSKFSGHTYIPGTTGSGKTRTFEILLIQSIARVPQETVIVLDPKGDRDLRDRCYAECVRQGEPNRFKYFSPSNHASSIRIDTLCNYTRLTQLASRVVDVMQSSKDGQVFKDIAWNALNVAIYAMKQSNIKPTLKSLKSFVSGNMEDIIISAAESFFDSISNFRPMWRSEVNAIKNTMKKGSENFKYAQSLIHYYKEDVSKKMSNEALDGAIQIMEHPKEHFSRITAGLIPILEKLCADPLGSLLSPDYSDKLDKRDIWNFQALVNSNSVVYISLESLADTPVGQALGSLFLSDLTSVCATRQLFADDYAGVNVFTDESSELVNESFIQQLNKGRSSKFRVFCASQTNEDFTAKMGDPAYTSMMLGNLNNCISLRSHDSETLKQLSEKFGTTYIDKIDSAMGTTGYSPTDEMDFNGNYMKKMTQEEYPLVHEDLLKRLANLHFFGTFTGGIAYKGRLPFIPPEKDEKYLYKLKSDLINETPSSSPDTHSQITDKVAA